MKLQSLRFHFARLARELGSQVSIGARRYRVKGYLPSQFAVDMGHDVPCQAAGRCDGFAGWTDR